MQSKKTTKTAARNTLPLPYEVSDPSGDSDKTQKLTALWLDNEMRLRHYIARRINDASVVEDIMQDVYIKAHQKFSTINSPSHAANWLFRVSANAVIDYYRRPQRSTELPEEIAEPEPNWDHLADLANCVRPIIETLPSKYQEALILAELEGLPQREIAKRSGISISGAKSRVQRGRESFKQAIRKCCDIKVEKNGFISYQRRIVAETSATPKCCG